MRQCMAKHFEKLAKTLAVMLVVACGGCTKTYTDYSAFINEPRPLVTATEYRMAPPDTIQIYSKRVREIHRHTESISPDGKITLPLLGRVFVAGKTTEEVEKELQLLAQEYYEDADVSVRVVEYASKKIFVFGEVSRPGPYAYNGANTVLDTMAKAQPTRLADPSKIVVLRPNADGELIRKMTVDLDKMVKEGDTLLNAVMEEGDIIYVPPTPLASVALGFQQLLLPFQPIASTIAGPATIENEARGSASYGKYETQD
ncbi:MAG: polysaccharide biosynthesis/export family protein [Phycisphaeraceae bacterium]